MLLSWNHIPACITLACRPSPGSIADMLLRCGDRLIPVLMQQRIDPASQFKKQPEALRLHALVLLLVHGVGLYVTTGKLLADMPGGIKPVPPVDPQQRADNSNLTHFVVSKRTSAEQHNVCCCLHLLQGACCALKTCLAGPCAAQQTRHLRASSGWWLTGMP